MKKFNLSEWALEHRSLVWYFMIVFTIAGIFSYLNLGREEDPNFTIKTVVISAQWPGASIEDTTTQVTDRIEKKLEELDTLDYTKSVSSPGSTTIFLNLKDTVRGDAVKQTWIRARNLIGDIQAELPQGVVGPFFNDDFGDVYGNVYGFTSDGLSQRQLRDYVEDVRRKILTVPDVGKVELVGAQDEAIYLEFSPKQVAALGLDQQAIISTLQAQNAITPSGVIETGPERVMIRVNGQFVSEKSLQAINLRVNDRFFRLSDVAKVTRGYQDPPANLFRVNGKEAIGLAIGMKPNGNLLKFGEKLKEQMKQITADLPVGVGVHLVSDQPQIVEEAVSGFTRALFEAVAIVLAVSFVSLGMRAGFVVALAIPLVLAITFMVMEYMGISLQRISLGALIIALGLLVDDAMIAVEMMVARLEAGDNLRKAATYVYTHTAFPMLTGTLVTVSGFIPVGLNSSAAGEFTYTLFVVIAVSLVVSWIVAVVFTPLLGVTLLPKTMKNKHDNPGRFTLGFQRVLLLCMRFRWVTIAATVGIFALSLYGMGHVQQQFFPNSDRHELVVDWNLPQNASILETKVQMDKFEAEQLVGNPDIDHWSSYVGQGAIRFLLSFDVQPANPFFGQTIIVTKSLEARDQLRQKFQAWLKDQFPSTDAFVHLLDIGPPVGRPVQYRISGPDIQKVRDYAHDVANLIAENKSLGDITFDWNEPSRVIKVDVLQDKARQLGITSESIATSLNFVVGGSTITQVRDSIYLINVIVRARADERGSIDQLRNLQLPTSNGQSVPAAAVANFRYELEQPVVWRRARQPTVTLKASVLGALQPATVVTQLAPKVKEFADKLPPGYGVVIGGAVEESGKAQAPIAAVAPLMLFAMVTLLMIQLQSFQRLFLVFAVAPLAIIGVVAALLSSNSPLGFVALLGVLALIGILIRNSVILVVQIEDLRKEGKDPWSAVVEATEHRMRPIMLTAAAASLALIPIAREIFWGPMAYAMMGGIIVGTVLTLLFLPALYIAWFRIKAPDKNSPNAEPHEPIVAPS
ncbi:efflux RND transporter permease subunit (plasmid) [Phyllobacterium sp. 628]|uniref:efflux RND transporter permease subunit n=1 Tax=Phyllobacterium sp. 628 TaxID=2718938 RepID=UPI001662720B|nr:efflux RND transporter permease subunit [Phyllobacterium sp. 628]QND55056.1 efflux RND transporter permease subunit [Phyllobacterium sp. 628]